MQKRFIFQVISVLGSMITFQSFGQVNNKVNDKYDFLSRQSIPEVKIGFIPYTEEMRKLSKHGNNEIKSLVKYIKQQQNLHKRKSALYCLYLIGVKEEGQFYDKFESKECRNALYELMRVNELLEDICALLIRSPKNEDIEYLIKNLKDKSITNYRPLVAALLHYKPTQNVFGGKIKDYKKVSIEYITLEGSYSVGNLMPYKGTQEERHIVQLSTPNTKRRLWELKWSDKTIEKAFSNLKDQLYPAVNFGPDFLVQLYPFFLFKTKGTNMYIYSDNAAKKQWLDWYKKNYE